MNKQATHLLPLFSIAAPPPLQKRIDWTWELPLWASLLLGGLAVAWILIVYNHENSPAGKSIRWLLVLLRTTAMLVLLVMVAQPVEQWFRQSKPRLVVLIDRSTSMSTMDVADQPDGRNQSRLGACKGALAEGNTPLLAKWQEAYELDIITFAEDFAQLGAQLDSKLDSKLGPEEETLLGQIKALETAEEGQEGTRLGDALHHVLRNLPGDLPAAIVLLTDGVSTRGRSLRAAAQQARGLRVPLYAVAIGSDRPRPDVAVEDLLVEEVVFPGDRLQVEATLRATGFAGQTVQVTLRHAEQNQLLAQTTAKLPADGATQIVRLAIRPNETGKVPLVAAVAAQPGEANLENNTAEQVVEVRNQKIKVLLVQSSPSYEFRALKSLLERDPVVDLRVRLQEADARFEEIDSSALATFPASQDELFGYDVILLGDVDPALLPRSVWPLLEQFVTEHGGGLVCIAGPRFMPAAVRGNRAMELLLPIEWEAINPLRRQSGSHESFRIRPTALGWQTPSLQLGNTPTESETIWGRLPPLTWMMEIERVKRGAQVLAEHSGRTNRIGNPWPLILRHYVGAGEVLFHATDETWRWRWQTDDRYFARYWGQVVRRLGRGRLAAGREGVLVTADRARYRPGESVQLQVRFRDPSRAPAEDQGVVVQLQSTVGGAQEIPLLRRRGLRGVFETTLSERVPGKYEVLLVRPSLEAATAQTQFVIQSPPRELARVAVDRAALREATQRTGGKFFTLDDIEQLSRNLPRPLAASLGELPPRPLWNTHLLLGLFVAALGSEWLLRRRHGML